MVEIICAILGTLSIIVGNILNTKVEMKKLKSAEKEINDERSKQIDKIEKKLDEHIAQSYRDKIMAFQRDLLTNGLSGHTLEEWEEIIKACSSYETYCTENEVPNSVCSQAIKFIKKSHQKCLETSNFTNLF